MSTASLKRRLDRIERKRAEVGKPAEPGSSPRRAGRPKKPAKRPGKPKQRPVDLAAQYLRPGKP
jgi:hypothetical protein